jgi:hypothetical protein
MEFELSRSGWWRRRASASDALKQAIRRYREASGIEPLFPVNPNPMMAHKFGFYFVKTLKLQRRFDSPGVPYSPLESSPVLEIYWRRLSAGMGFQTFTIFLLTLQNIMIN